MDSNGWNVNELRLGYSRSNVQNCSRETSTGAESMSTRFSCLTMDDMEYLNISETTPVGNIQNTLVKQQRLQYQASSNRQMCRYGSKYAHAVDVEMKGVKYKMEAASETRTSLKIIKKKTTLNKNARNAKPEGPNNEKVANSTTPRNLEQIRNISGRNGWDENQVENWMENNMRLIQLKFGRKPPFPQNMW